MKDNRTSVSHDHVHVDGATWSCCQNTMNVTLTLEHFLFLIAESTSLEMSFWPSAVVVFAFKLSFWTCDFFAIFTVLGFLVRVLKLNSNSLHLNMSMLCYSKNCIQRFHHNPIHLKAPSLAPICYLFLCNQPTLYTVSIHLILSVYFVWNQQ